MVKDVRDPAQQVGVDRRPREYRIHIAPVAMKLLGEPRGGLPFALAVKNLFYAYSYMHGLTDGMLSYPHAKLGSAIGSRLVLFSPFTVELLPLSQTASIRAQKV